MKSLMSGGLISIKNPKKSHRNKRNQKVPKNQTELSMFCSAPLTQHNHIEQWQFGLYFGTFWFLLVVVLFLVFWYTYYSLVEESCAHAYISLFCSLSPLLCIHLSISFHRVWTIKSVSNRHTIKSRKLFYNVHVIINTALIYSFFAFFVAHFNYCTDGCCYCFCWFVR